MMHLRGLRLARHRQGLSISKLAELTGLRRELIGRLERGQEEPQPYTIKRLATTLQTSPAALYQEQAEEDHLKKNRRQGT
jgi:transcriptional regulator with XRE-family HTH domain